jgi:hypothetical protein
MRLLKQFAASFIVCVVSFACTNAHADFTFAAYGDTPYTEEEERQHINLIGELNREPLAFVLHVGDFKSGWAPCTDALYLQRRDEFAMVHHALIYTPGDNEWTDCWRGARRFGTTHDPLERLQKLRSLFFADAYSLGLRRIALTRQSAAYPEHARWAHEGVLFATLNVPGSGNNARMPAESAPRGQAIDAWIAGTFAIARAEARRAVVLVFHANPFSHHGGVIPPYRNLMTAIAQETLNFSGEVLLIHGDTHRYRVDQPLVNPQTKQALKNFTRIEVFGYPYVDWVRVRVSERGGRTIFTASPGNP